ncbi:MAG: cytochrome c oxidase assembly protein [Rhodospirillales bacterium]|jgi:cytochrome c oxidase assembly protein subunit 11|nr:cytochrome c oxidase assembly protein [Rhodospirillales bacterium]
MTTNKDQHQKVDSLNARVGLLMAGLAVGMLGLAYASVPLYKLFCSVTGYGGTPKINVVMSSENVGASDQIISVALDANVNSALNWTFRPDTGSVNVRLGEESLAIFRAKNTGVEAVTGTAAFNVTPFKAAQYVSKIDCFCFTEQRLESGEEMPMAVSFFIDPAIADDPNTRNLTDIVLSYTFYPSRDSEDESKTAMLGDPIDVK